MRYHLLLPSPLPVSKDRLHLFADCFCSPPSFTARLLLSAPPARSRPPFPCSFLYTQPGSFLGFRSFAYTWGANTACESLPGSVMGTNPSWGLSGAGCSVLPQRFLLGAATDRKLLSVTHTCRPSPLPSGSADEKTDGILGLSVTVWPALSGLSETFALFVTLIRSCVLILPLAGLIPSVLKHAQVTPHL